MPGRPHVGHSKRSVFEGRALLHVQHDRAEDDQVVAPESQGQSLGCGVRASQTSRLEASMAHYDLDLFQVHQRWHYRILKVNAKICPESARVGYDSRTHNHQGYDSQSVVRRVALSHKAKLVAVWKPVLPSTD